MQIRRRLREIAKLVDKGVPVVDIGCDHAFLDIYLTLYNGNSCTASDINENALMNAKQNIEKYNLKAQITTVLSDGLEQIDVKKGTTLIISGMGTSTMKHILSHSKRTLCDTIIVQSNNELSELRRFITKLGYQILEETVILDRNIYYVIIKWKKGRKRYRWWEYEFGPYLCSNSEISRDYFQFLIKQKRNILSHIPKKNYIQTHILKKQIRKLEKMI